MKKIISTILSIIFVLSNSTLVFAVEPPKDTVNLSSENGDFSVEVNVESPISLFSLFDKEDPVVKSIEKGIEISSTVSPMDTLTIKLSLPEGAHLEEKVSEETDESIVLIYNSDGFLMGVIDQAYITN